MEVKPLTIDNIEDFYGFMKETGFEDCQCVFFYRAHIPGEGWQLPVDEMKKIRKEITIQKSDGFLGYLDGKPVIWTQVIKVSDSVFLEKYIKNHDADAVAISCFLVHPNYRRKGLARKIMGEIIESLLRNGVKEIYGIPVNEAVFEKADKKYHDVLGHTGYINIFEEFGFKEIDVTERYIIVKRC